MCRRPPAQVLLSVLVFSKRVDATFLAGLALITASLLWIGKLHQNQEAIAPPPSSPGRESDVHSDAEAGPQQTHVALKLPLTKG